MTTYTSGDLGRKAEQPVRLNIGRGSDAKGPHSHFGSTSFDVDTLHKVLFGRGYCIDSSVSLTVLDQVIG